MMISWLNKRLRSILSWILGLPDYGFFLLKLLGPLQPKFYRNGYGDIPRVRELHAKFVSSLQDRRGDGDGDGGGFQLTEDQLIWGPVQNSWNNGTVQEGRFRSPLAHELSPEMSYAHFYLVQPKTATSTSTRRHSQRTTIQSNQARSIYIFMLPATGETDIYIRLYMAKQLANQYGWCSVIMTAPYYANRKPQNQTLFFLNTVQDTLLQALAIIHETVALTTYFLDQSPTTLVCLTGFSFGAAMAVNSAHVALQVGVDGPRLSCASYVGSDTPCVLADGMMESAIHWNALRHSKYESLANIQTRLFAIFQDTQMRRTIQNPRTRNNLTVKPNNENKNSIGVVKACNMLHDAFIQTKYALELEGQIQDCLCPDPSFEMTWLPGGHALAAIMRPIFQKQLIVDTVLELIASKSSS